MNLLKPSKKTVCLQVEQNNASNILWLLASLKTLSTLFVHCLCSHVINVLFPHKKLSFFVSLITVAFEIHKYLLNL